MRADWTRVARAFARQRPRATASAARRSRSPRRAIGLVCIAGRGVRALARAARSVRRRQPQPARQLQAAGLHCRWDGLSARHRRPGARHAVRHHVRHADQPDGRRPPSVLFAMVVGVAVGLVAGYAGGVAGRGADARRRRPADLPRHPDRAAGRWRGRRGRCRANVHAAVQFYVLVFAIGISRWPQFARTVRGSTLVERGKDYVLAARVIGHRRGCAS